MGTLANTIQNKALASYAARAPEQVLKSIKNASARTGVNFAYLLQQASTESSFNPKAKAKTSSASGLYQFIESTWLSMVKKHGEKYGMGDLAEKIDKNGKVHDKALRKEILALRNDPEKASALAAEFANENKEFLEKRWGGEIGSTELYMAHFMGAGGASAFLKERDENPLQKAAILFPEAAKANRNVFYDTKSGRPKTMDEVYAFFDRKFSIKTDAAPSSGLEIASLEDESSQNAIVSSVFRNGRNASPAAGSFHPSYNSLAYNNLVADPLQLMVLSQMDLPTVDKKSAF